MNSWDNSSSFYFWNSVFWATSALSSSINIFLTRLKTDCLLTDTGNTCLARWSPTICKISVQITLTNVMKSLRIYWSNKERIIKIMITYTGWLLTFRDLGSESFGYTWQLLFCFCFMVLPSPAIMLEHGNISWNSPVHDVTWCSGRVSNKINKQYKHSPQ